MSFEFVKHIVVGGVKTACLSRAGLSELMAKDCLERRKENKPAALIFDSNGQGISMAATNASFAEDLKKADIIHADGTPVVVASKLLSSKSSIPERSATTDFIHDAAKTAQEKGLSFYLLGGEKEVVQNCVNRLKQTYPNLNIVGFRDGYFSAEEEVAVCDEVSKCRPDVVWVGLGKPKEQRFCVNHKDSIKAGWLVTCGGCFNYITGDYSRAPGWMQKTGLEWLHRAATNPKKLLWRYLKTTPHALFLILTRTRQES